MNIKMRLGLIMAALVAATTWSVNASATQIAYSFTNIVDGSYELSNGDTVSFENLLMQLNAFVETDNIVDVSTPQGIVHVTALLGATLTVDGDSYAIDTTPDEGFLGFQVLFGNTPNGAGYVTIGQGDGHGTFIPVVNFLSPGIFNYDGRDPIGPIGGPYVVFPEDFSLVNGTNIEITNLQPGGLFIAQVPETASWVLMIGGFFVTAAALRRRRPHVTYA